MFPLFNSLLLLLLSPRTSLTTHTIWLKYCPFIIHREKLFCSRCLKQVLIGYKAVPAITWVPGKLRGICHALGLFEANSQEISWPRRQAEIIEKLSSASPQKWHTGAYTPWQALQWDAKRGDNLYIWILWETVIKIVIRSLSHCQNVQFNYKSWMYYKYICVALGPYSFPCAKISFGYSTSFSQAVNFGARRTSWLQDETVPEWILAWQSRGGGGALGH